MSDKFAIYGSDVSQSKDGIANGIRETAGPTNLAAGEIVDGEYLVRSGNKIISAAVSAVTGPATQIIETNGPTTLTIAGIVDGEFLKRSGATVISAGVAALTPGAANTVFVTNGAATLVITALLVNANVDAAAAIAGTKINPAFGAQAISTSSTLNVGAATTTALTVSTFGTGIVHSSVAGVFSSSLIVAADVTTGTLTTALLAPGSNGQIIVTTAGVATWSSPGGDLTGTYPNPTVARINGATVPVAGALTTGNGLYVTGVSALSYSALNLAGGSNYVTGILPTGNQAAQTMAGDVTGTTAVSVVSKVNATTITTAGGALTVGTVLRVTAVSTADWGAVDLANASAVTGLLPIGNLAPGAASTVFATNVGGTAVAAALLVNANVDAAAAIAGSKVSPDFGAQNITTTGTLTHADLQRGTVQTTNATPTTIITYSGLSANDRSVQIVVRMTGLKNNYTEAAGYYLAGTFRRTGGTITQVGSTSMLSQNEDTASWDATFTVSGTDILVQVTGVAATTIDWKAVLETVKNI